MYTYVHVGAYKCVDVNGLTCMYIPTFLVIIIGIFTYTYFKSINKKQYRLHCVPDHSSIQRKKIY